MPRYVAGDIVYITNPQSIMVGNHPELGKACNVSPRGGEPFTLPSGDRQTERKYRVRGSFTVNPLGTVYGVYRIYNGDEYLVQEDGLCLSAPVDVKCAATALTPKYKSGDRVVITDVACILKGYHDDLASKLLLRQGLPFGVPTGGYRYQISGSTEWAGMMYYGIMRVEKDGRIDKEYIVQETGLQLCEAEACFKQKFKIGDLVELTTDEETRLYIGSQLARDMGLTAYEPDRRPPMGQHMLVISYDATYNIYGVCSQANFHFALESSALRHYRETASPAPKFDVGALVHVTDWSWVYDNDGDTAKTMWLDKHGWKDSQAPYSSLPSLVWRVVAVQELRNVCGIVSMGCSGRIPMQAFVIGAAGLASAGNAMERLRTVAVAPVSISDCTMDGVTKYDYVKAAVSPPCPPDKDWIGARARHAALPAAPHYTATCRLRFPNGEEVECPAPPESDGWQGLLLREEFNWPVQHIKSPAQIAQIVDPTCAGTSPPESIQMWWHEYRDRAIAEQAQVLWIERYRRNPQPPTTPEAYQKVYEWL